MNDNPRIDTSEAFGIVGSSLSAIGDAFGPSAGTATTPPPLTSALPTLDPTLLAIGAGAGYAASVATGSFGGLAGAIGGALAAYGLRAAGVV